MSPTKTSATDMTRRDRRVLLKEVFNVHILWRKLKQHGMRQICRQRRVPDRHDTTGPVHKVFSSEGDG
jgi:hypothetical protein